jgi:hypothetical protein
MTRNYSNSSPAWDRPFDVRIGRSRWFALVFCVLHGAAILAILVSATPVIAKIALTVIVVVAFGSGFVRHVCRSAGRAIVALSRDGQGRWWLTRVDGTVQRIDAMPSVFVSGVVVVLALRCSNCFRSEGIVICADGVEPATFLTLRRALVRGV